MFEVFFFDLFWLLFDVFRFRVRSRPVWLAVKLTSGLVLIPTGLKLIYSKAKATSLPAALFPICIYVIVKHRWAEVSQK